MIRDEMPEARISVAASVEKATDLVRSERVDIAFVNLAPGELAHSNMLGRMEALAVTVVLMGALPDMLATRHRVLELPFVRSAVAEALQAAARRIAGIPTI